MAYLLTVLTGAAALSLVAWMFDGISIGGATIARPNVALLSLPLYILTLGSFFFVVNALMLLLTSWIAGQVGVPFEADGFWTAVFGAIVIALASALLGIVPARSRRDR